jgi:hypothetical protein
MIAELLPAKSAHKRQENQRGEQSDYTSGAVDLANADATTNTNRANGARAALSLSAMTSQYFMLPTVSGKIDL